MQKCKVVLVSDGRRNQDQLLRKLLGGTPAALVEANSGRDCLDQVSRYQVRLVVLDGDPPDIKVSSLIQLIKKLNPNVNVIFIAGEQTANEEDEKKIRQAGVAYYAPRPLNYGIIEKVLNKILAKANSAQA